MTHADNTRRNTICPPGAGGLIYVDDATRERLAAAGIIEGAGTPRDGFVCTIEVDMDTFWRAMAGVG